MKATFISKEGNNTTFTMVYTSDEFENAVVDSYKKNKDKFQVNGFRRGKAPRKMIENLYGADIFYDDALNNLLQTGYPDALNELNLEVIDQPRLKVDDINKGEDVTITATVACFPEEEVKDYFGIEVEKIDHEVTDEDVQNELERVQKQQSRTETVTDRKTEDGDTVVIDFDGSVDGEHFDGGKAENFELKLGSGQFIPGFEDQLIGKDAGEEVNVSVTFPEDYGAKDLAGKDALFECKIHEIKKEILPEINDEFASDVSEFETLDEYKKDIRERLEKEDNERAENIMKDSMLQKLHNANDIDVPDVMVEDEITSMLQEMSQQLAYQGLSLDQYKQYLGMDDKMMRDQARDEARNRVAKRILLRGVVNQENIDATEDEINKELEEFGKQYGQSVDEVKKMLGDNIKYFEDDVKTKKAIDLMFEKANFVEPKKEEEKEEAPVADAEEEK